MLPFQNFLNSFWFFVFLFLFFTFAGIRCVFHSGLSFHCKNCHQIYAAFFPQIISKLIKIQSSLEAFQDLLLQLFMGSCRDWVERFPFRDKLFYAKLLPWIDFPCPWSSLEVNIVPYKPVGIFFPSGMCFCPIAGKGEVLRGATPGKGTSKPKAVANPGKQGLPPFPGIPCALPGIPCALPDIPVPSAGA